MTRIQEIANAKGAVAKKITRRDRAYVCEFYHLFGTDEFAHAKIANRRLSSELCNKNGVKSGKLDDRTVLGRRLLDLGLITHPSIGTYQLTGAGIETAKKPSGARAL